MLVLDANILVRAILGRRVRALLTSFAARIEFFAPDVAFAEEREHLPVIMARKNIPIEPSLAFLG